MESLLLSRKFPLHTGPCALFIGRWVVGSAQTVLLKVYSTYLLLFCDGISSRVILPSGISYAQVAIEGKVNLNSRPLDGK